MPEMTQKPDDLNILDIWQGFKSLLPISVFVLIFAVAFGLAAIQTGLEPLAILSMSASVFAGASQFAVLELWGTHVSLLPLMVTVFFINARHLLMGAALYPFIKHLPPIKRYGILLILSDANWVLSMQAFHRHENGIGILVGGGLALWLAWLIGTWVGLYFGYLIHHPMQLGLDMVMACFLLTMAIGGKITVRTLSIWLIAGCSSIWAYVYLPENSHVVLGALAGGVMGSYWKEK